MPTTRSAPTSAPSRFAWWRRPESTRGRRETGPRSPRRCCALGRRDEALAAAMEAEGIGRAHLRLTLESLSERQGLAYAAARPKGLDIALSIASEAGGAGADCRCRRSRPGHRPRRDGHVADASPDRAPSSPRCGVRPPRRRSASPTWPLRRPRPMPSGMQALLSAAQRRRRWPKPRWPNAAPRSTPISPAATSASTPCGPPSRRARHSSPSCATIRTEPAPSARPGERPLRTRAGVRSRGPSRAGCRSRARADRRRRDGGGARDAVAARGRAGRSARRRRPRPRARSALRRIGAALRERVWDPVAAQLDGIDQVFVVPDGALNLMPLAALPADGGRYLRRGGPDDPLPVRRTRSGDAVHRSPRVDEGAPGARRPGVRPDPNAAGRRARRPTRPCVATAPAARSTRWSSIRCPRPAAKPRTSRACGAAPIRTPASWSARRPARPPSSAGRQAGATCTWPHTDSSSGTTATTASTPAAGPTACAASADARA